MASNVRIVDQDRGATAHMKRMKLAGNVDVGVQGNEAAEVHEDPHGDSPDKLTVVDVATVHEFGDPENGIPRRSFIRDYVDHFKSDLERRMIRLGQEVLKGKELHLLLDQFGLVAVGEIQTRMSQGIPPPNSAATIARKGSDTPLIDTGQLRSSITHKVTTSRRLL